MKRDLNFEIENSRDYIKMLTGALMDARRGTMDTETAKNVAQMADKLNKGIANELKYKEITKSNVPIPFLEPTKEEKEGYGQE